MKRIMVDMSATILHHGHIRLLKKAREIADETGGAVVVALSTDETVLQAKGYTPELSYEERKEIMSAIKYVDEVVPTDWWLTDDYLKQHNIDILLHGDDNVNDVEPSKLKLVPRTEGVSSSEVRQRVLRTITELTLSNKTKEVENDLAVTLLQFISKNFTLD